MVLRGGSTIGSDGMRKLHEYLRCPQTSNTREFHETWLDGLDEFVYVAKAQVGLSTRKYTKGRNNKGPSTGYTTHS
jgi:hypothetical protein